MWVCSCETLYIYIQKEYRCPMGNRVHDADIRNRAPPHLPPLFFLSLLSVRWGGWVWRGWGWDGTHAPAICPGMHRFIHVCVYPFKGDMRLLSFTIVGISTFIKVYVTIPKMRIYGNVGGIFILLTSIPLTPVVRPRTLQSQRGARSYSLPASRIYSSG